MKYCYHCGQALADDYEFCPICGKNVPPVGSLFPTAAPPVYTAEPLHVYSTSARVLTGLSKGLGIPALVLSIIASLPLFSWVLSGDVSAESDPNVFLVFLILTSVFAVPALLLSIFAEKQGALPSKGRIFGIIGCAVCTLLLVATIATL